MQLVTRNRKPATRNQSPRYPCRVKLQIVEFAVVTVLNFKQFLMGAAFHDLTVVKYNDPVGILYSR
jgi:hypothetical protein